MTNKDIEKRKARLRREIAAAKKHIPGPARDEVIKALEDRLRVLERFEVDTEAGK